MDQFEQSLQLNAAAFCEIYLSQGPFCGKRHFPALGFSGDVKLTPSVVRASTQHWKLGWTLNSEALGCTLPVVRKLKTEILEEYYG